MGRKERRGAKKLTAILSLVSLLIATEKVLKSTAFSDVVVDVRWLVYGSAAVPGFSSCCEKVFYLHFCFISL